MHSHLNHHQTSAIQSIATTAAPAATIKPPAATARSAAPVKAATADLVGLTFAVLATAGVVWFLVTKLVNVTGLVLGPVGLAGETADEVGLGEEVDLAEELELLP